ncbi:hypothetical protein KAM463_38670 [Aeromonas caviae]|nr:hypothetical protein KAM463_38670 [Aeromonas caviae]
MLPIDAFMDRVNYISYANSSILILMRYIEEGKLVFLFNEPVWLMINVCLNYLFEAETVVRIIIGLSASLSAFLVLKHNNNNVIWLVLILFSPQIIKNYIIHLRQGVGICFFIIGWFSASKKIKAVFYLFAMLTHSSFFIVLFLLFFERTLEHSRISYGLRISLFMGLGLLAGFYLVDISEFLGARQSQLYDSLVPNVSGSGFIYWLIIFFMFITSGAEFIRGNCFSIQVIAFYLTTYFFIVFSGRIFESAMLIVTLSVLHLPGSRKLIGMVFFVVYIAFLYLQKINTPYLGFGAV